MFRVVIQVTCMVLLASVFYDVLSCNRFKNTQTFRYINEIGSSKYGKLLLKKFRKVRKKYLESLVWPSCMIPTNQEETVNQVEPYVHFVDWPMNLKYRAISMMHHLLTYLDKSISSLQYPTSISIDDLVKVAKEGLAMVSQQIQKFAETTVEYVTKTMPYRYVISSLNNKTESCVAVTLTT